MSEHIKLLKSKNSRQELLEYLKPLKKGVVVAIATEIGLTILKSDTKQKAIYIITEFYMFPILNKMIANR